MVTDVFGVLLSELGRLLNIPDLHPDSNNSCLIQFPNNGPKIQLELSKDRESLLMGMEIGFVNPGRYRIDVFKEALKANGQPPPRYGTFAWSKKADVLFFYKKISLHELTGEKVYAMMTPFIEKAQKWQEAISKGEVPVVATFYTSGAKSGMFGLIK
jgi:hypothetical protein